ncbi:MAG: hypothetical protein GF401_10095 [Chitinivibrionales bacterium]|nr:hypothetical protein [Chitinivibrionales bacterium]
MGKRLIIGTGADAQLPVMKEVEEKANRKGVELIAVPTREACEMISREKKEKGINAIIHVTC